MECNKEEAIKAKELAEKKLENKDYLGAQRIAIKAQKLYPQLDSISQLITVCDVHCAAAKKLQGTGMDWYGILNLEPTADDILIKKQFRKFALFLHPDKNKFSGAADAFKLISEAQGVLLDQEKRRIYDTICKYSAADSAPKQSNNTSNVRKPPGDENNPVNTNEQFQQAPQTAQTGFYGNRPSFWTRCPFCSMLFQYYRDLLHQTICCHNCKKAFTCFEVKSPTAGPENRWSHTAFSKQTGSNNQAPVKMGPQSNAESSTKKVDSCENTWSSKVAHGSELDKKWGDVSMSCDEKCKAEIPQSRENMNEKKRKKILETSNSCNSEADMKSGKEASMGNGFYDEPLRRRSIRSRNKVSYSDSVNDDDDDDDDDTFEPTKGGKCRDSSQPTRDTVGKMSPEQEPPDLNRSTGIDARTEEHLFTEEELQNEGNEYETKLPSADAENKPEIHDCPAPDFSDFNKNREGKCFAAGQIWALFDTKDAIPRCYALVRKVFCPKFKLRITWLESDPNDMDEIKWVEEDLPVSCGNFRLGSSKNTEDQLMFSHLVSWDKGSGKDTYKIYPRKGETWALFKNWDINWSSDPDNNRNYEYEFVEVLSDFTCGTAISVAYLGKVKGYVCLFCRTKQEGVDIFEIKPKELFRFSHMIPSLKITAEGREDVPKGSFKLDPACLPTNLQEIDPLVSGEIKSKKVKLVDSCSTFSADTVEPIPNCYVDLSKDQADQENHSDLYVVVSTDEEDEIDEMLQADACSNMFNHPTGYTPISPSEEAYEIPDTEFYDFDANKSLEKFEIGQIWAMYCDEDGMPKYYGLIKKIDLHPEHILHVAWLGVASTPNTIIQWKDKNIPITCGRFKVRRMKHHRYTTSASFSHQVRVRREVISKKEEFVIMPRRGEVWALYKNWNTEMKCSELENCEYDVVEVAEKDHLGISVLCLEVVNGFKSVFRAQVQGQLPVTLKIPANELLRFSHQVPSFRLTVERGGTLKGYLELDPAAMPIHWFCSD